MIEEDVYAQRKNGATGRQVLMFVLVLIILKERNSN